MDPANGSSFLNDTSLSKTPKSPVTTSTAAKGKSRFATGQKQYQDGDSLFSVDASVPALNEVTNIPDFLVPKPRFNLTHQSILDNDANLSSLGILKMDMSDFSNVSTPLPKLKSDQIFKEHSKSLVTMKDENFFFPSDQKHSLGNQKQSTGFKISTLPSISSDSKTDTLFAEPVENTKNSISVNEKFTDNDLQTIEAVSQVYNPSKTVTVEPSSGSEVKDAENSFSQLGTLSSIMQSTQKDAALEASFQENVDNLLLHDNPFKFNIEEISARSSSFRSPSATTILNGTKTKSSSHVLPTEDLKDEILCGSLDKKLGSDSPGIFAFPEISKANLGNKSGSFEGFSGPETEFKFDNCKFSDSEFGDPDKALEMFNKDENAHKDDNKFKIHSLDKSGINVDETNGTVSASWLQDAANDLGSMTLWFKERTECLGKLSMDSQRERPYFGKTVESPIRTDFGNMTTLSEASECSSSSELARSVISVTDHTAISSIGSETFGNSFLSRILQDASTMDGSKLASMVLQHGYESCKKTQSIKDGRCLANKEEPNNPDFANPPSSDATRTENPDMTLRDPLNDHGGGKMPNAVERSMHNKPSMSDIENRSVSRNSNCPNCNCAPNELSRCSRPQSPCSSTCSNFHTSAHAGCSMNAYNNCLYGSLPMFGDRANQINPFLPRDSQLIAQLMQQALQSKQLNFSLQGSMLGHSVFQGSEELHYPEKISVGDKKQMSLNVHNPNQNCFYHVSVISAFINETPVSSDLAGVSFPAIVPSEIGSSTNIQILICPKYEGTIHVNLLTIACFNATELTTNFMTNFSLKTKVQYESLRPRISISSKGKNSLNLGSVIAGSSIMEHVTISNECLATVPLCLHLSNDFEDHRISFAVNALKRQNTCNSLKILSHKAIMCALPQAKDDKSPSSLDFPLLFETGNSDANVSFTLTAGTDPSNMCDPLGFFRITASVGVIKLELIDSPKGPLILKSRKNSAVKQHITVVHRGTFPVIYDLLIDDETNSFHVSPLSLKLQPMQRGVITITFSPMSTQVIKSFLQAAPQPHGKAIPLVEIIGDCKPIGHASSRSVLPRIVHEEPTRDTNPIVSPGNYLECNRKFLAWGGVDVGHSLVKTCSIRNASNSLMKTKIFIKDNSQSFKIVRSNDEPAICFTLDIESGEEKHISVQFQPKEQEVSSGLLAIKSNAIGENAVFTISLGGYGNTGKLKLLNVPEKTGIGYCLEIHKHADRLIGYADLSVQNTGSRPIFVKILVSPGHVSNSEGVVVQPNEFVLMEDEIKILFVSCTMLHNSVDSSRITLLYGDEIMRQQMRRSKTIKYDPLSSGIYHDVNFDTRFDGDDRVPNDPVFNTMPKDEMLFNASVKKYLIQLNVTTNDANGSAMFFDALSVLNETSSSITSALSSSRRLTDYFGFTPSAQDIFPGAMTRLSMPRLEADGIRNQSETKISSADQWSVAPQSLSIDASSKENRIVMTNLCKQDLKFRIDCAIDVISVSPVGGILPAKGQIGLRITVIPYTCNLLTEDYNCTIKICCGGVEKNISVKVLREQKRSKDTIIPESSEGELNMPLSDSPDQTLINPAQTIFIPNILLLFPNEVKCHDCPAGRFSETILRIQNLETSSIEWSIQPNSMIFTEPDQISVKKDGVFRFDPSYGIIASKAINVVTVKFMPTQEYSFSQFHQLNLKVKDESSLNKSQNFEVKGKGTELASGSSDLAFRRTNRPPSTLVTDNENCDFPVTAVGATSCTQITLKNFSSQDIKVFVTKPNPPFKIEPSTITVRSKKYSKVTATFKPTKASRTFEDEIVMRSENKRTNLVFKLKAMSGV